MNDDTILMHICCLPREFRQRGNVSMINLIRESGYLNAPDAITEERLEQYFRANPKAIDAWLLESMDQRCVPSWYLTESTNEAGTWSINT